MEEHDCCVFVLLLVPHSLCMENLNPISAVETARLHRSNIYLFISVWRPVNLNVLMNTHTCKSLNPAVSAVFVRASESQRDFYGFVFCCFDFLSSVAYIFMCRDCEFVFLSFLKSQVLSAIFIT